MTEDLFGINIIELEAEHKYLMESLSILTSPADRLDVLERLKALRERLHAIRDQHIDEIKAERSMNRLKRGKEVQDRDK